MNQINKREKMPSHIRAARKGIKAAKRRALRRARGLQLVRPRAIYNAVGKYLGTQENDNGIILNGHGYHYSHTKGWGGYAVRPKAVHVQMPQFSIGSALEALLG